MSRGRRPPIHRELQRKGRRVRQGRDRSHVGGARRRPVLPLPPALGRREPAGLVPRSADWDRDLLALHQPGAWQVSSSPRIRITMSPTLPGLATSLARPHSVSPSPTSTVRVLTACRTRQRLRSGSRSRWTPRGARQGGARRVPPARGALAGSGRGWGAMRGHAPPGAEQRGLGGCIAADRRPPGEGVGSGWPTDGSWCSWCKFHRWPPTVPDQVPRTRNSRTHVRSNTRATLDHVFDPFKAFAEQTFDVIRRAPRPHDTDAAAELDGSGHHRHRSPGCGSWPVRRRSRRSVHGCDATTRRSNRCSRTAYADGLL